MWGRPASRPALLFFFQGLTPVLRPCHSRQGAGTDLVSPTNSPSLSPQFPLIRRRRHRAAEPGQKCQYLLNGTKSRRYLTARSYPPFPKSSETAGVRHGKERPNLDTLTAPRQPDQIRDRLTSALSLDNAQPERGRRPLQTAQSKSSWAYFPWVPGSMYSYTTWCALQLVCSEERATLIHFLNSRDARSASFLGSANSLPKLTFLDTT